MALLHFFGALHFEMSSTIVGRNLVKNGIIVGFGYIPILPLSLTINKLIWKLYLIQKYYSRLAAVKNAHEQIDFQTDFVMDLVNEANYPANLDVKQIFYDWHHDKVNIHSSEIRGLCLMKCPSKLLQNLPLPYFWSTKTNNI